MGLFVKRDYTSSETVVLPDIWRQKAFAYSDNAFCKNYIGTQSVATSAPPKMDDESIAGLIDLDTAIKVTDGKEIKILNGEQNQQLANIDALLTQKPVQSKTTYPETNSGSIDTTTKKQFSGDQMSASIATNPQATIKPVEAEIKAPHVDRQLTTIVTTGKEDWLIHEMIGTVLALVAVTMKNCSSNTVHKAELGSCVKGMLPLFEIRSTITLMPVVKIKLFRERPHDLRWY